MKKIKEGKDAVITVFFSMIMILIFSLILTSLEYTRAYSLSARASQITGNAMESVFSSYAKEVFDEYGVMMLWKTDDEFLEDFETYAEKNSDIRNSFTVKPSDYFQLQYSGAEITHKKMVLDSDAEEVEKQICNYMQYALGEDLINHLINQSQSISTDENIINFNEKLENCNHELDSAIKNISDIKQKTEHIEERYVPLYGRLDSLKQIAGELNQIDENEITLRDEKFEEFKEEYLKYREDKNYIGTDLEEIVTCANQYETNIADAKAHVQSVKQEVQDKKDGMLRENYDAILRELEDIEHEIDSMDTGMYHIEENRTLAEKKRKLLRDTEEKMKDISSDMDTILDMDYKLSEYENNHFFLRLQECMKQDYSDTREYNSGTFFHDYTLESGKENGEEEKVGIIELVEKIKNEGLLGYVVEGEISENKLKDPTSLPSRNSGFQNGKNWRHYDEYETLRRNVLVTQYIFDKFHSYTDKGTESLCYEVEYILNGKESDKENLKSTVDKLLAVREGFNFLFLLRSHEKREEAYGLALAVTGFTGIPAIIRITQFLILGAWAYAESVVDIRDLLKGYSVELFKTEDTWNLSLAGALELQSDDNEKDKRRGFSYEDYVRGLLMLNSRATNIYRILDLIQINMQSKYNSKFYIKDCLTEVSVDAWYESKRVFTSLRFVEQLIYNKSQNFEFTTKKKFEYK